MTELPLATIGVDGLAISRFTRKKRAVESVTSRPVFFATYWPAGILNC